MRIVPLGSAVAATATVALLAGCGGPAADQGAASPASPSQRSTSPGSTPSPSTKPPRSTPPGSPSAVHATEFSPPGDIPDNAVFVDHVAPGSRVHFTVPEGWAQRTTGAVTTYTDKYNSISIEVRPSKTAPTVASVRSIEVPALRASAPNFALQQVSTVTRQHGQAVHVTYLADSKPNPVTDKVVRDAIERFDFWKSGQEAILTLTGPQGTDNVDPWQTVSDSLQWK